MGVSGFWIRPCAAGWVCYLLCVLWWHQRLSQVLLLQHTRGLAGDAVQAECWLSTSAQGLPLLSPAHRRARGEFWYRYMDTVITELVSWGLKHLVCVGLLTAVLLRSSLSHKWGNMRELSKQVSQLGAKKKKGSSRVSISQNNELGRCHRSSFPFKKAMFIFKLIHEVAVDP